MICNEGKVNPEVTKPPHFNVPRVEDSPVFIIRSEEIKKITDILLEPNWSNDKQIIGLWGLSGCGKTTLIKMICNQPFIREFFSGGIFWIEASDSLDEKKQTEELSQILTDTFQCKKLPTLIILDDVTNQEKLSLFLRINSNRDLCKWLITTTMLNVFDSRKCIIEKLGFLKTEELNTALITILENEELVDKDKIDYQKIKELADLLYHSPLLLNISLRKIQALINSEKIQGLTNNYISSENILIELTQYFKELNWIDLDDEKKIHKSINKTFHSLTRQEKKCFLSLLIFLPDLNIPFSVVEKLWNLPIIKVKIVCNKLYQLSLIQKVNRKSEAFQLSSYTKKSFLQYDDKLKQVLTNINIKFVEYYVNQYNLNSPDNLPDTIPLPEQKFLKKVIKYHWRWAYG